MSENERFEVASPPTRVAVVGAGPAGFFATAELLRHAELHPWVDMFDRLPTPYGLVRNGVAPDHQSIKAITHRYEKDALAAGTRFRLFGNVEIGRDLSVEELRRSYHALVFAFGAQSNRRMGIPGESLRGVHPASVFVGWYNGHPDCLESHFDLSARRAVVVGVGNVALDVARILVKPLEELARTDISDVALRALERRAVEEVLVVGRQGPAQASFTPAELEELTKIPGVDLVVSDEDRRLDPESEARRAAGTLEARVRRNLEIIETRALRERRPGHKAIRLRFFRVPVEVQGYDQVGGLRLEGTRLVPGDDGPRLERTGQQETIACGLVFRSIGYRVTPLAGVPFDAATGTVPHLRGQVLDEAGRPVRGAFVTGWAKRGPTGVIGTNKPDAGETVASLLAARERRELLVPSETRDVADLLLARGVPFLRFSDWKLLDQLEVLGGTAEGRPRKKFTDVPSMLRALAEAKLGSQPHAELVGSGADSAG